MFDATIAPVAYPLINHYLSLVTLPALPENATYEQKDGRLEKAHKHFVLWLQGEEGLPQ